MSPSSWCHLPSPCEGIRHQTGVVVAVVWLLKVRARILVPLPVLTLLPYSSSHHLVTVPLPCLITYHVSVSLEFPSLSCPVVVVIIITVVVAVVGFGLRGPSRWRALRDEVDGVLGDMVVESMVETK